MIEIKSLSQFNKAKANTLLIIDFYATWCGPCKVISPRFDQFAKQHAGSTAIIFAKCDVDKAKDVAAECGISAMPTFQFFKAGKKVDEVKGADVPQLTTKIGYYTAAALKEAPAQASAAKPAAAAAAAPNSLGSLIDINASKLLNTSNLSSVRNIASPPPAGYAVASVGGPQFLIHLVFTEAITPTHLKLSIVKDGLSNAPSRIQIGTNVVVHTTKSPEGVETNDLEMESISKAENTQAFNVFSDEYVDGTAELKLKASKFTGIKSMTIRVDANLSGEDKVICKVGRMELVGGKA